MKKKQKQETQGAQVAQAQGEQVAQETQNTELEFFAQTKALSILLFMDVYKTMCDNIEIYNENHINDFSLFIDLLEENTENVMMVSMINYKRLPELKFFVKMFDNNDKKYTHKNIIDYILEAMITGKSFILIFRNISKKTYDKVNKNINNNYLSIK